MADPEPDDEALKLAEEFCAQLVHGALNGLCRCDRASARIAAYVQKRDDEIEDLHTLVMELRQKLGRAEAERDDALKLACPPIDVLLLAKQRDDLRADKAELRSALEGLLAVLDDVQGELVVAAIHGESGTSERRAANNARVDAARELLTRRPKA